MVNVIFQFFIGNPKGYICGIRSVADYCKKYKLVHCLSQSRLFPQQHIMFEKYQLFDLYKDQKVDRILYLDSDIIITPSASNIFDEYEDSNYFYAYDENDNTEWMDRDRYLFNDFNWPINSKGKKQYFNAGVMLFPKNFTAKYPDFVNFSDIPAWENIWYFGDQTPINYWTVKNNIPFKTLSHSFNRMDLGNFDPSNERFKANFIHYAGPCKYGTGNKIDTMISDYNFLYGN